VFLRRCPEDLGMFPDGIAPASSEGDLPEQPQSSRRDASWNLADAMRTGTLWLLVTGTFLASIGTGGIAFHLVAYFTDRQIDPAVAAGALSIMALAGAFGNGLWGALAERVPALGLSIVAMLLSAASVALLTQVQMPLGAYIFAVLFGFNARGSAIVTQILLADYYGRRSYGAISSVIDPFHKGGLGLGALLAGAAFDLTGGYRAIFVMFMACYILSALLILFARQPRTKEA
jgi:predicted MFS family arabinose efflux permease